MPRDHDTRARAPDRRRADRDRAGLRVRLLGHAGVQGAARGGHRGRPRELEPGHDHDRPGVRDRTYIEPITPDTVARILELERPDAVLPTLGGQTALNCAIALAESGVLEQLGVRLIGAQLDAILMAEDRLRFSTAMREIGLDVPKSVLRDRPRAGGSRCSREIGLPAIIRPSFTLGGSGGSIAETAQEFEEKLKWGLHLSPRGEVLVEESRAGLEGVRARGDARPRGQRGDRLLDRELRSDGRAHR